MRFATEYRAVAIVAFVVATINIILSVAAHGIEASALPSRFPLAERHHRYQRDVVDCDAHFFRCGWKLHGCVRASAAAMILPAAVRRTLVRTGAGENRRFISDARFCTRLQRRCQSLRACIRNIPRQPFRIDSSAQSLILPSGRTTVINTAYIVASQIPGLNSVTVLSFYRQRDGLLAPSRR